MKLNLAIFTGYVMRLYYEKRHYGSLFNDLCDLACDNDHLDLCDVENLPGQPVATGSSIFPKHWRTFPSLDAQVLAFVVSSLINTLIVK